MNSRFLQVGMCFLLAGLVGGAPSTTANLLPESGDTITTTIEYWQGGGLKSIRQLDAEGRKVGAHFGWWPNGTLKFQYAFEAGLHAGESNEWLSDGTLFRAFNYVAGKESGLQRMWFEDGTLRANYVVKNGRRFGLIGSKPCS